MAVISTFANLQRCNVRAGKAAAQSPPLWGRCPAGQRGATSSTAITDPLSRRNLAMLAYLLKRLGIGVATLFVASVVVFAVLEVLPGDPAQLMLGFNATPEALAALREQMGLDQPVVWRYLDWIGGMLTLDFGRSYTYSVPVIDLVRERLVVSLPLALHGAHPVDGDRHSGRHLLGRAARPRRRYADHGCRPARRRRPQFLVRADPHLRLRGVAAAGAGRRLSRLERRDLAGAQGVDPAGDRAGAAAGSDPRPRHPLGAARSAERGLYPHRPRQGHAAPRRAVAARAAGTQ